MLSRHFNIMIEHPKFNYTATDISVETRNAFVLETNITELASVQESELPDMQIPGIKDKTVKILKNCPDKITTTHHLLVKFLMLKKPGMTEQQHCDAMWDWLKTIGIDWHRSGIIKCLAAKINTFLPDAFPRENQIHRNNDAAEEAEE